MLFRSFPASASTGVTDSRTVIVADPPGAIGPAAAQLTVLEPLVVPEDAVAVTLLPNTGTENVADFASAVPAFVKVYAMS